MRYCGAIIEKTCCEKSSDLLTNRLPSAYGASRRTGTCGVCTLDPMVAVATKMAQRAGHGTRGRSIHGSWWRIVNGARGRSLNGPRRRSFNGARRWAVYGTRRGVIYGALWWTFNGPSLSLKEVANRPCRSKIERKSPQIALRRRASLLVSLMPSSLSNDFGYPDILVTSLHVSIFITHACPKHVPVTITL